MIQNVDSVVESILKEKLDREGLDARPENQLRILLTMEQNERHMMSGTYGPSRMRLQHEECKQMLAAIRIRLTQVRYLANA